MALFISDLFGAPTFDSIIVSQPSFLTKVDEMLANQTIDQWKNYLLWNVINHYADKLSDVFIQKNFDFYGKVLSGKTEMKPINDRAIDEITNKEFGEILGKLFVKQYFSQNAQTKVNTMVDNLLAVFKERIKQLDWMTDDTKKEALNKLNSIGRKLGFPSKWENFSGLLFEPMTYVANVNMESLYSHKKKHARIEQACR
jgi:putative endopeptidase